MALHEAYALWTGPVQAIGKHAGLCKLYNTTENRDAQGLFGILRGSRSWQPAGTFSLANQLSARAHGFT